MANAPEDSCTLELRVYLVMVSSERGVMTSGMRPTSNRGQQGCSNRNVGFLTDHHNLGPSQCPCSPTRPLRYPSRRVCAPRWPPSPTPTPRIAQLEPIPVPLRNPKFHGAILLLRGGGLDQSQICSSATLILFTLAVLKQLV